MWLSPEKSVSKLSPTPLTEEEGGGIASVLEHLQRFFEQIFSFQVINSRNAKKKLLGAPVETSRSSL